MLDWQIFATANFQLTENPAWDSYRNGLWWLDIPAKNVYFKSFGSKLISFSLTEEPGALWLQNQQVWVAGRDYLWRLQDGSLSNHFIADQKAPFDGQTQRFNDVAWTNETAIIGSLIDDKSTAQASVYQFQQQKLTKLISGFTTVNGLGINHSTLIIADTFKRHIGIYDWQQQNCTCHLAETLWHRPQSLARPDGLLQINNDLYFAMFEGAHVMKISMPSKGGANPPNKKSNKLATLPLPVFCPTKLGLGGSNQEYVFLTSAGQVRSSEECCQYPLSGKVLFTKTSDFMKGFDVLDKPYTSTR